MNKVLLTGRLTRDPEMRSLASGKVVTTFTVASNEFIGGGKEKAECQGRGRVEPVSRTGRRPAYGAGVGMGPGRTSNTSVALHSFWVEDSSTTYVPTS